jgi:hypothetical protein
MATTPTANDDQLADDQDETWIDAEHRWRREGIADEVAAFRIAKRKELRSTGLTKQQAGEKAWAMSIREFPPPEEKRKARLLELDRAARVIQNRGQRPPEIIGPPGPGELDFADVYAVFYAALSARFYLERAIALDDDHGFSDYDLGRESLGLLGGFASEDDLTAARRAVLAYAIHDFAKFLDIAEAMFSAATNQLGASDAANSESLDLLARAMAELSALRLPIIQHEAVLAKAQVG